MSILPIIEKGNPILDSVANAVKIEEIIKPRIQKIITDMQETLAAIDDGVGLAAPQVNIPLQIFIVSKRVLKGKDKVLDKDIVCINPKIVKFSKTKKWLDGEGCLSVRWFYGRVLRSINVTMEYYDEFGQKTSRGAGGLLAHIFQHECDHLEGELFIDKAVDIEYIEPEIVKHTNE
ncbi:peptide deformylase [Arenimonas sp.]|nr:peptide deformylase [Candidatus Parcubacteria bacterium]